jgi:hypothetical protein
MSVNSERPHVLVLPEDQANTEIANGFKLHPSVDPRRIQVMKNLGGWTRVLDEFERVYVSKLNQNPNCHIVMLIDFDGKSDRRTHVDGHIPDGLRDRVFVVGVLSQPEKLKEDKNLGFEKIGWELAEDCPSQPDGTWNHDLLKHNAVELGRMWKTLGAIIFPSKADIRRGQ